jgi:colanic acid biosynthesis protein WcaH
MWLSDQAFREIVRGTPLIAIDLVVTDENGRLLLGRRINRPAQGSWFVPGGRIRKGEHLGAALERLTVAELGRAQAFASAKLLGVYEHFYDDTVFGNDEQTGGTHYVVLAYRLRLGEFPNTLPCEQHSDFAWWETDAASESAEVHPYTKAYVAAL